MKFLPVMSQKDLFIILSDLTLPRSRFEARVMKDERIRGICSMVYSSVVSQTRSMIMHKAFLGWKTCPELSPVPEAGWKK